MLKAGSMFSTILKLLRVCFFTRLHCFAVTTTQVEFQGQVFRIVSSLSPKCTFGCPVGFWNRDSLRSEAAL